MCEENLWIFDHKNDYFFLTRGIERGIKEIDKSSFEKVRSDSFLFLKSKIRLVKRNRAGIEIHMKTGSTDWKELGRNRRNPRILKEKAIFLLHISISRKTNLINWISKKQKFWKILENFFVESFEKMFLWYDMNVHDFKWSSKPKFSKRNSNLSNFLTLYFSHTPKMY